MSRRADQAYALGHVRSDVPWDRRGTDQPSATDDLVRQFRAKGGQIRQISKGKKTLNDRQIDLLTRREYSQLAVETAQENAARADKEKRRMQRG